MLAAAPSPRGSDANLSIVGYVVGGFHDESLPSRHGSADGAARLMNYSFLQTIISATSGHNAKAPITLTILLPRLGQCDQKGSKMTWAQLLAYVTGTLDQELLLRNELCLAKTSYTRRMNDLRKTGFRFFRYNSCHDCVASTFPRLVGQHFPFP